MNRTLLARVFAVALLLTGCWIAYTQNQGKQPPSLNLNKVKDDLYEIEGDGGNVAVYVTGEGVVLVDDKFEQDHESIIAKVKSTGDYDGTQVGGRTSHPSFIEPRFSPR